MGPGYANLPSHQDDMKRLIDESMAAKESATLLQEAVVFTRPEELANKPIIRVSSASIAIFAAPFLISCLRQRMPEPCTDCQEFYQKCFHAHESLTNQIEWAQAEAAQSRERAVTEAFERGEGIDQDHVIGTIEEEALAVLLQAHGALADALRQHDELERLASEERELREVRERSKKETRLDRNVSLSSSPR